MINDIDADQLARILESGRYLYISLRRMKLTRWMIMRYDDCGRFIFNGGIKNFPWVYQLSSAELK